MTTNRPAATLYQTTWKQTFASLHELALQGIESPGPLLGEIQCPAAQYTFAVSEDGGIVWRNPTDQEKRALIQAVVNTGRCCQGLTGECWPRMQLSHSH